MDASIVDLRYKMKDVLKALERKEKVCIRYHGKIKGVITPVGKCNAINVKEHPFFGMKKGEKCSVEEQMKKLRGSRYDAV